MRNEIFLYETIYRGWQLPAFRFDKVGELCAYFPEPSDGTETIVLPGELIKNIRKRVEKSAVPVIYVEKTGIYFLAFSDDDGNLYVFGPAAMEPLTFRDLMEHKKEFDIHGQDYKVPHIPWREGLSILLLSYAHIREKTLSADDVLRANKNVRLLGKDDVERYEYSREMSEQHRLAYSVEQKWVSDVENGIMDERDFSMSPENLEKLEGIGMLADNSFKQMEYMAITTIVLASRAAMRGGVSTFEAYSVSDLYFQKVAKCEGVLELLNVYIQVAKDFSDRVKAAKANRSEDIVEQACDYVARHRTHPIRVADIAKEIGVSAGYLSRKFTETRGITLQDYIMKQRLSAGANMLTYSDLTIGEIAEYLSFSSPSHFGHYFREEYDLTPQQYRKIHKVIDF